MKHLIKWLRWESGRDFNRKPIGAVKTDSCWKRMIAAPLLYSVEYTRLPRGDLIVISWRGKSVISYVDQDHQYGEWMGVGLNDFIGRGCHLSTLDNWAKANRPNC